MNNYCNEIYLLPYLFNYDILKNLRFEYLQEEQYRGSGWWAMEGGVGDTNSTTVLVVCYFKNDFFVSFY